MKLLYDEHLPRSLVPCLAELFPDSAHVGLEGLESCDDLDIWAFAKDGGFANRLEGLGLSRTQRCARASSEGRLDSQRELLDTRVR